MKITLPIEEIEELLENEADAETADEIINGVYLAFDEKERAKVAATPGEKSLAYRKVAISCLDEEGLEAFAAVQSGFGLDFIAPLNGREYASNPYYVKVCKKVREQMKLGDWVLEMKTYQPYELFVYDEVRPSPNDTRVSFSPLGFFAEPFPYPALSYKGTTYMSLIPHEINTMADPIKKAHGHVLTMGLGMGYFAYMASQKEEVLDVTILERDPNAIKLFERVFLPLFDHPEKIHITRVIDAITYSPSREYDYCFVDLHHDAIDGLPHYLALAKRHEAKQTDFWIEKAILTYFRRHLIALIEEEVNGYQDEDYQKPQGFSENVMARLHFHLKNYEVHARSELDHLLSDDSLRRIAVEMK